MRNIFLSLGLGLLFTHELDAVANFEWRVLPLVRSLPDDTGMVVFIAAHVPLFAVVIALIISSNLRVRELSRSVACIFLIVHAVLHIAFSSHADYEFSTTLSNLLIFGGALFGALYFLPLPPDQ